MRNNNWKRVKQIFEAGLDCPKDERQSFLDRECGQDASLRQAVEELLASDEQTAEFLNPPSRGAAMSLLTGMLEDDTAEPRQLGKYRLVKTIASGGMGTVYAAVRVDGQYDQEVAVKLIKPGMATEDILRRFRQERQTLARFDHPNIARILDGGAADNGAPYLVMEYIHGKPLHRYCDDRRLTINDRLDIFRTACSAVQYAHRNLVVHRDLKPGNMLVSDDGQLKLLDFGIAKILDDGPDHNGDATTDSSQRYMTPQYASPEQLRGDPITTASDVYSLGVVLYELLTGHRPYEIAGKRQEEAKRMVDEADPALPSTAVFRSHQSAATGTTTTPEAISLVRKTQPDKLRRHLQGDLDTIVLTAMHKDIHRRYQSVEQFADDIDRYLSCMPVRARRDSVGYKFNKFIKRHKLAVTAGILLTISIAAGTVGTVVGLVNTAAALSIAEDESAKAQQVTKFLEKMLAAADPNAERTDATVREVLDQTAARLDADLVGEPAVRAAIHHVLGTTYASLGAYDVSEEHLRKAIAIREDQLGAVHLHTADSLNALGGVLHESGRNDEAEVMVARALDVLTELNMDESASSVPMHTNRAKLLQAAGRHAEAVTLFENALDLNRDLNGDAHPNTLHALNNVAAAYARSGDYAASGTAYRHLLDWSEETFGAQSPWTLAYANNFAALQSRQGDDAGAEQLYREIVDASLGRLGEQHPHTLKALSNLAFTLRRQGQLDEAEALYQRVLDGRTELLGEGHRDTILTMNKLGLLYREQRRMDVAERMLNRGIDAGIESLGANHPAVMELQNSLALLYVNQRRYDEAEPLFRQIVEAGTEVFGPSDMRTLDYLANLSSLYIRMERTTEAEAMLNNQLALQTEALGAKHVRTLRTRNQLAFLLLTSKRYGEALEHYEPLAELYTKLNGETHRSTLIVMNNLGRTLLGMGRADDAEEVFVALLVAADKALPEDHWLLALFEAYYGDCMTALGRYEEAERFLLGSYEVLKGHRDASRARTVAEHLVSLYETWNKPDDAAQWRDTFADLTSTD